jgi:hypothetical protein
MYSRRRRGPHLVCYRCDSLDVDRYPPGEPRGRCRHCDYYDMVARCLAAICAACAAERAEAARR